MQRTSMSSPILRKISGLPSKHRSVKILVLGQAAVGKTAFVVRYVTKRFIGDYDPTLEKVYTYTTEIDGEYATFDVLDTAGQDDHNLRIEENIRWADAYILVYSITDRVSFEECTRLKFLINYAKKSRRSGGSSGQGHDIPVFLVGNKNDLDSDRMVDEDEGIKLCQELNCTEFHEISVRESFEDVRHVFEDAFRNQRIVKKPASPKLYRRSPPNTRRERSGTINASVNLTSGDEVDQEAYNIQKISENTKVARSSSISKRIYQKVFKKENQTGLNNSQNLYIV